MMDINVLSLSGKHSSTKKNNALARSLFLRNRIEIYLERMKKLKILTTLFIFGNLVISRFYWSKADKKSKDCNVFHSYATEPRI